MNPPPFPHRMVTRGRQVRHDPLLGHAFEPNICRRIPHEHGAYFAVTNAEGFREDHDLAGLPRGNFHVACYGDSYAAGDGVNNQERFSAILARQLGVTVSNLAVPGYGPDQNVMQLEGVPLPRPDLILWCIAVHTIERIQSAKNISLAPDGSLMHVDRPHFVLAEDDSLELRGVPVAETGDTLVERPGQQIQSPAAARWSTFIGKLRSRLVAIVGPYLKPAPDTDYTDPTSPAWRLLSALVQRFHTAADGVPVAIVPLPTTHYLTEFHEPIFQQRFQELENPAAGLHVVDVVTAMCCAPRQQRRDFNYRLDGHYTAAGHTAVAAALVEQLRLRDLVAGTTPTSATEETPSRAPLNSYSLHVGWQLDDGFAQLRSSADGSMVVEHRESTLAEQACRPGVLPISAVQACLDDGHVAGPELRSIVLRSPDTIDHLANLSRDDPRWFPFASGWIRWHGAAEVDLRRFLFYQGPVEHAVDAADASVHSQAQEPAVADDDELQWLRQRVLQLPESAAPATLRRRLRRLARRWELATRAARDSVFPTTGPLRRGRMALQLARAAEPTGSAPPRG